MPLTQEEMKKLFSSRLSTLMEEHRINQVELSKILGVSESTVGKWILMKSIPRMGVIQKLADYFHVGKSYFLEEDTTTHNQEGYYTDPEVAEYANKLKNNPDMRLLFDAAEDMTKDDIDFVVNMIESLKKREGK